METKELHPSKQLSGRYCSSSDKTTDFSFGQSENTELPSVVTLSPMFIVSRFSQSKNAAFPIDLMLFGKLTP